MATNALEPHDAIHDTFVAIMRDVSFHLRREQLHTFPATTFNSFRWRIDIVLTKDSICTLVDIVIADPKRIDLFPWSCATQGFVAFDAAQAKERSYRNWHPTDQFLSLTIEIFGCLHKHANVFLHDCLNAIWSLKGTEGLHLFTLVTFLHQKISITL
jgi:hypothetical protein